MTEGRGKLVGATSSLEQQGCELTSPVVKSARAMVQTSRLSLSIHLRFCAASNARRASAPSAKPPTNPSAVSFSKISKT